jgi:hypothetical protein
VVPDNFKGQRWSCPYSGWHHILPNRVVDVREVQEKDWLTIDNARTLLHFFQYLADRETFYRKLNMLVTSLPRHLRRRGFSEWYSGDDSTFWWPPFDLSLEDRRIICPLIREIFGNPFHPIDPVPNWLSWQDSTIVKIARSIDVTGQLNELPVLADALEEAGCHEEYLLAHCREQREHVAGCWAIDLLLGRHFPLRT